VYTELTALETDSCNRRLKARACRLCARDESKRQEMCAAPHTSPTATPLTHPRRP
jgi:hypothetical protein